MDPWKVTVPVKIDDLRTVGWKYRVVISATGKKAWFPIKWTEIRPGHAIIPVALAQRILGTDFIHGSPQDPERTEPITGFFGE